MKNNKLKNVEKRYRELGVEGDDVFTLIASEYIQFHKLDMSERLISIIKKANEINCNGSSQKMESIAKRVVRYDKLGKELPILYQFFHSKRFRDNTGKFFTPRNIAGAMADMLPLKNDAVIFDPTCGGGTFLLEASQKWKNRACHLVANDIDNYLVTLTEIILKIQIPKNTDCLSSVKIFTLPKKQYGFFKTKLTMS